MKPSVCVKSSATCRNLPSVSLNRLSVSSCAIRSSSTDCVNVSCRSASFSSLSSIVTQSPMPFYPNRLWRHSPHLFSPLDRQQLVLALHPPTIPARIAILAHYAMTRDRHRNRIAGARPRHRTRCFRPADPLGNLAITSRSAVWNRPKLLPHQPLERSGLDVQRQRLGLPAANAFLNRAEPTSQIFVR